MTLLSDLVTTLRARTDTSASQFVTDSELAEYLNSSLAELDDLLVATFEDYKVTTVQLTIASSVEGSNYLTLPADFLKSRRVERQGSATWIPLHRFQIAQQTWYATAGASFDRLSSLHYRIEGSKCWVIPWSNAAGIYRLWYVPRYLVLASGDALPDYMNQQAWTEFAICDSGAKVMQKQDLDPSIFLAQKQAQRERVLTAAGNRDAGPPRHMIDTRGAQHHRLRGYR